MLDENEKITKDFYSVNAAKWSAGHSNGNYWENEREQFKKFLPSGKIIDLGCGGGRDTAWFLENNYGYVGVDISAEMLEQARLKNPTAEYLLKDFYSLDFKTNEFEGFWAACSLVHIPKAKIVGVLENIRHIVKPGAIGFIALKKGDGEKLETYANVTEKRFFAYYSQAEFKKILEQNNFKILQSGEQVPSQEGKTVFLFYIVEVLKN